MHRRFGLTLGAQVMASGTDKDDPAELHDASDLDVESVDESAEPSGTRRLEDEDGLAPEAGSRRPSLVSLLLIRLLPLRSTSPSLRRPPSTDSPESA